MISVSVNFKILSVMRFSFPRLVNGVIMGAPLLIPMHLKNNTRRDRFSAALGMGY